MCMAIISDDSFTGDDGFRYVLVNDEFGYIRESPSDVKSRLYYESYELEKSILISIKNSDLKEPTLSFCIFSVQIAQVERLLNDYYDSVAILCTQTNPMATMKKPTAKQKRAWSAKADQSKAFQNLSLGQKHLALSLVEFITNDDIELYRGIMTHLSELVEDRNKIIHFMFNTTQSTEEKLQTITRANEHCEYIFKELDKLDSVFRHYITKNLRLYYGKGF